MAINKFSEDVAAKLQHYVYVYVDEKGQVVYVGRGSTANRAFSHLSERIDDGKSHNWRKLERIDKNTSVYIVHSGMSLEEAQHCETALINFCRFQKTGLTNIKDGDKFIHQTMNALQIDNEFSKESVLLEEIFEKDDKVVVLAISDSQYFKSQNIDDSLFEIIQHEDGFRLYRKDENKYKNDTPTILCIIHNKVIRGVYKIHSEIEIEYSAELAFAFITIEMEQSIPKYNQYVGRRIEKKNSRFSISERRDGNIHFLY